MPHGQSSGETARQADACAEKCGKEARIRAGIDRYGQWICWDKIQVRDYFDLLGKITFRNTFWSWRWCGGEGSGGDNLERTQSPEPLCSGETGEWACAGGSGLCTPARTSPELCTDTECPS